MTQDPTEAAAPADTPDLDATNTEVPPTSARKVSVAQVPILGILAVLLFLGGVIAGSGRIVEPSTVIASWLAILLAGMCVIGQVMVWQLTVKRPD